MTEYRKEIFFSSSIIVVLDIIILFAQWAMQINSGSMAVLFMYFAEINEWSMAIPLLFSEGTQVSQHSENFMPYRAREGDGFVVSSLCPHTQC